MFIVEFSYMFIFTKFCESKIKTSLIEGEIGTGAHLAWMCTIGGVKGGTLKGGPVICETTIRDGNI